jgi:serine/threonine-protein kinase
VIHRDIKPANVLLDGEGNCILTDFGIAKVTAATNLTQTGSTIGTPSYMSPEQCRAGELSSSSDQYSLGVVAYEMLAGRTPFSGSAFEIMQAHNAASPASIGEHRPDCPEELESAVLRMLAKRPEDRFPSVAEAIEAIGGYIPGPRDPIRQELARLVESGAASSRPAPAPLKPTPFRTTLPAPAPAAVASSEVPQSSTSTPKRGKAFWTRPPVLVGGVLGLAVIVTVAVLSLQGPPSVQSEAPVPTVAPERTISFPAAPESLLVGGTIQVSAVIRDAEGQTVSGETIAWSSDDTTVATVEGLGEEVVVAGISPGSVAIRASAEGVDGTFTVLVSEPTPGRLNVSAPRREILIDQVVPLSAELLDQGGSPVPDAIITWSSNAPGVVEVDPATGAATGRGLGTARVTASSGERTGTVNLRVVGLVEAVAVNSPARRLVAGGRLVLRVSVRARPDGYLGANGVAWNSSDPSVAAVSSFGADSAVVDLLREGEVSFTARADAVQGSVALRVEPAPAAVTVSISPASISFEMVEGGGMPPERTVAVSVTGEATPSVGVVTYGAGASGWLRQSLGMSPNGGMALTVGAETGGIGPGTYTARVPIGAGGVIRELGVQLVVAPNPDLGPVEPTAAAARGITTLLEAYLGALNSKDTRRVRQLFPSLAQDAIDELLRLPDTDQYYIALQPGSLRMGSQEGTLDGDVLSGVLGPDGQGELRRVVYTFGRGDQGWFIVSFRAGG